MRIVIAAACLVGAVALSHAAQPGERRARISTLWPGPAEILAQHVAALEEGLAAHGWNDGNMTIVHHFTDGRPDTLAQVAARIAASRPDAIWTPTNAGAIALQSVTGAPIVVGLSQDPVAVGLAANLARPGGHVTGMTAPTSESVAKRLAVLLEIEPEIDSITVLYASGDAANRLYLGALRGAVERFGLTLEEIGLNGIRAFDAEWVEARLRDAQALIVLGDSVTYQLRERIAGAAIRYRLITIATARDYCMAGILLCFGSSLSGQFRQSADYLDRILIGADPATLPMLPPAVHELAVNVTTARTLHIDVPAAMIARADEVIE
ncbi:MAG TPA: ABC transporter substrate-binding protein [Vicinamibacterales bacterium]|nr:ABC transporter substrate-binding protein [Vicinamibacterales bacterium]